MSVDSTNVVTPTAPETQPATPAQPVSGAQPANVATPGRQTARQIAASIQAANGEAPKPAFDPNATIVVPETDWSIDQFMEQDFTGDPIMGTEHKDLPPFKEILARHVSPEGKKLISNLRSDYSRKTQELSTLRKQLEAERATLAAERASLLTGPVAEARRKDAAIDLSTLDPYVEDDLKTMLRVQAAQLVEEQLKPLRASMEARQQEQNAQAFVNAHPELNDPVYKTAMIDVLKSKPNMDVETAFELARAKVLTAAQETARQERQTSKQTGREYFDSPRGNKAATAGVGGHKSAREIYMSLQKANKG